MLHNLRLIPSLHKLAHILSGFHMLTHSPKISHRSSFKGVLDQQEKVKQPTYTVCTLTAPCLLHVIHSAESHGVLSLPSEKCSFVPSHNLPAYKHAVDAAASGLKTKWELKPVSTSVAKVWCYSVFPIYRRQHQAGITKNTSLEHKKTRKGFLWVSLLLKVYL